MRRRSFVHVLLTSRLGALRKDRAGARTPPCRAQLTSARPTSSWTSAESWTTRWLDLRIIGASDSRDQRDEPRRRSLVESLRLENPRGRNGSRPAPSTVRLAGPIASASRGRRSTARRLPDLAARRGVPVGQRSTGARRSGVRAEARRRRQGRCSSGRPDGHDDARGRRRCRRRGETRRSRAPAGA
jgi:hypothetical protein